MQIKSNATTSSNKIINTQTKTSDYIVSSGSKTIKFASGSYKVTIQSGSSGGGGGGGRSGNADKENGYDGVKGSDSFITYRDKYYIVKAPNAGVGGKFGGFQGSGEDGSHANTCVDGSSFTLAGKGGAGGTYGGSSTGGAGGDGGYCTKDINLYLTLVETVTITAGNSGNGGNGGSARLLTEDMYGSQIYEDYPGGVGGNSSSINGVAGTGSYDMQRFYAAASGGGGGSGPNGKVIITPLY